VKPEPVTLADPSVRNRSGGVIRHLVSKHGEPSTIATEYREQSGDQIHLLLANNDPKAGRARISELLIPEPGRPAPFYARHLADAPATPRIYIVGSRCPELVDQLENAPLLRLDSGRRGAGEIVDPGWEGQSGHAVASLRYGVMSKPEASEQSFAEITELEWEAQLKRDLLAKYEARYETDEWQYRAFDGGPRYIVP
jgi:hypothetical protein